MVQTAIFWTIFIEIQINISILKEFNPLDGLQVLLLPFADFL